MPLNIEISASWTYGDAVVSDPGAAFSAGIEVLQARLENFNDVYKKVADEVFEPAVAEQIASEGSYLNTPWEQLADSTAHTREKLGYGGYHPMLIREGNLERSFTASGADHVEEITEAGLLWGSSLPKSLYLHTGTQEGFRIGRSSLGRMGLAIAKVQGARGIGMPGRPIFAMTEELGESVVAQFMTAVAAATKEARIETNLPGEGR
jgi:hypothetical protein